MCGDSYNDTLLPARGHKFDMAGTETTYTYADKETFNQTQNPHWPPNGAFVQ